jgi:hypothetical protein
MRNGHLKTAKSQNSAKFRVHDIHLRVQIAFFEQKMA